MKKTALIFTLCGAMGFSACDPDKITIAEFNITPNTGLSITGRPTDYDLVVQSVITNTTNEDISITWLRSNIQQPNAWTNEVCDPVQCWSNAVNSKSFTLPANARDTIVVHFYPHGQAGTGSIDLSIYKTDDPSTIQVYEYSAIAE